MRIGIIGAGHIGVALTRRFRELNHSVSVASSRGSQTLAGLAQQSGASAVTVQEPTRKRDVIIVAIPEKSVADLARDLFIGVPDDVVVIDSGTDGTQRDGLIEEIECGMSESRRVPMRLSRPVVKANKINAQHLLDYGKARGTAGRIALPIAGDHENAKVVVTTLLDKLGFDAAAEGGLDNSRGSSPERRYPARTSMSPASASRYRKRLTGVTRIGERFPRPTAYKQQANGAGRRAIPA